MRKVPVLECRFDEAVLKMADSGPLPFNTSSVVGVLGTDFEEVLLLVEVKLELERPNLPDKPLMLSLDFDLERGRVFSSFGDSCLAF